MRTESDDARRRRGEATRSQLIRAATELFARRGFEATSIEAVLHQTGVSKGALYHHFRSKEDLFEAVFVDVEDTIGQRIRSAAAPEATAVGALRAGCSAWISLTGDPVVRRIIVIDAPAVLGWRRWRQLEETHALGLIRIGLQAVAVEGRLPAEFVDVFAHMLLASLNEIALMIADSPDVTEAMRSADAAITEYLTRLVGAP